MVFIGALVATAPTTGDIGLTWDEPAYRYSQLVSIQWWEQWPEVLRGRQSLDTLLDSEALLYYWPYGRHGINFHPPLAGQANLLTYALFGGWLKDMPARRLASVLEFSLAIALLFGFLGKRYGLWVGLIAAGALLTIPRVYGHAHIAGTDMPILLLWPLTALAVWKGLNEPKGGIARVAVGILLGLAFLTKMAAVAVLLPIFAWILLTRLPGAFRKQDRLAWLDALITTSALLAPLAVAFLEIRRLAKILPPPASTNLFLIQATSELPGAILLVPLFFWLLRRGLALFFRNSKLWGVERPALELWAATLAFAPAIGWLGNPAWWREALPRLAHYYMLNVERKGALPDIRIHYWGENYLYSLPWHNAWVLLAITVPATLLLSAIFGLIFAFRRLPGDTLPLYFLVHFATLPALRMLSTPAHDGVRLFLPTFFFLAAFVGWGTVWLADRCAALFRRPDLALWFRGALASLVLGSSSWQLVRIHPFELSYYNEFIGGPAAARRAGFELTYWYDAFNPKTLAEINDPRTGLPKNVAVTPVNEYSNVPVFPELQALGELRPDLQLDAEPQDAFSYKWMLAHDSKADPFARLLFALTPVYERRPEPLEGLRVAGVAGPLAVSRAWALTLLASEREPDPPRIPRAEVPDWVRSYVPRLGRFWGEGVARLARPRVNEPVFDWARNDPEGLRAAAMALAKLGPDRTQLDPNARRLLDLMNRQYGRSSIVLLRDRRPEALVEAAEILIRRPEDLRRVLSSPGYTDPNSIGQPLDAELP